MSFRGRGGGGGGRGFGRGGRGGRGRGGGGYHQDLGPPEHVVEVGTYLHPCENDLVCKSSIARVPYFNAPIYLENKSQVGKIDEIFGPFNEFMFSVKLSSDMLATSFSASQKLYIDPMKLLPLSRFLPAPKGATGRVEKRGGRGGGRGGRGRGGGGGFRGGGRGGFRGGGRGGGGFRRGRGGGRGGFRGRGRH